jgi:hypothetical protein
MFKSPIPQSPPDAELTRYLLGALSEDETNRIDELSVVDDEVAARLCALEDDLVDAYASGTLKGEAIEQFERSYLNSPQRRAKARFAKSLQTAPAKPSQRRATVHRLAPPTGVPPAHAIPPSQIAAAALALAASALIVYSLSLRRTLTETEQHAAATAQRASAIAAELEAQRKATAIATRALADARTARPAATVALVLRPETRGIGPTSIISIAAGSTTVPVDLQFDSRGAASYEVALKDPATNQVVWRSAAITAQRERRAAVVSVSIPAALLRAQHYALDLFELRESAPPEFVGTYAFEVTRQ